MEPKRRALEEANAQLQDAQTKLKQVKDKVLDLEATLEKLTGDYQKAIDEKMRCQEEADATNKTIQLANRYAIGAESWECNLGNVFGLEKFFLPIMVWGAHLDQNGRYSTIIPSRARENFLGCLPQSSLKKLGQILAFLAISDHLMIR